MKVRATDPVRREWLMLVYKIPREPTASRVYVWRKLKQLGALPLQDAVWVLPATSKTQEQFQWLAAEIEELAGEATLWRSAIVFAKQEAELVRRFGRRVEVVYREIQAGMRRKTRDVPTLARRFQQAQLQDYFQSAVGARVKAALLAARDGNGA